MFVGEDKNETKMDQRGRRERGGVRENVKYIENERGTEKTRAQSKMSIMKIKLA